MTRFTLVVSPLTVTKKKGKEKHRALFVPYKVPEFVKYYAIMVAEYKRTEKTPQRRSRQL